MFVMSIQCDNVAHISACVVCRTLCLRKKDTENSSRNSDIRKIQNNNANEPVTGGLILRRAFQLLNYTFIFLISNERLDVGPKLVYLNFVLKFAFLSCTNVRHVRKWRKANVNYIVELVKF